LEREMKERQRAEEERRQLEHQMIQAQKMESMGVMAGGIAHDFNNLLVGILGNADAALMQIPANSPIRNMVEDIDKAAEQAADLCKQLLAYSGAQTIGFQPLDLTDLVKEMKSLLVASVSKRVELEFELSQDLPPIEGEPTQIRQIVMNLVINASEASSDNNVGVRISCGARYCDDSDLSTASVGHSLQAGRYVFLVVSDSGMGMDAETQKRIFDPFFTTKFSGRGLGLAAVLGIVQSHGAAIRVESEVSQGTTVEVLFPMTDKMIHLDPVPEIELSRLSVKATVLVIDDEEVVRAAIPRLLEPFEMSVLTAATGRAGIEIFEANKQCIDLIILDLTMPEMSGAEVFRKIKSIKKETRIIISSGYAEKDVRKEIHTEEPIEYIQKPYKVEELIRKITKTLKI